MQGTDSEEPRAARRELLRIADDLESVAFRLRGVRASLPESIEESFSTLDIDEMEPGTHLRAVIDCVLSDRLGPAIHDLREAARATEENAGEVPS
jgi:hypothetical protein